MPQFITPEMFSLEPSKELRMRFLKWYFENQQKELNCSWSVDYADMFNLFEWDSWVQSDFWKSFVKSEHRSLLVCAHDLTVPEVFQYHGDRVHRACWTLASKRKKCGAVFVYGTGFGLFDDLSKGQHDNRYKTV